MAEVTRATSPEPSSRPGPKREAGAPSGPEEVREALLDTASRLFAEVGVDNVSLRDVAKAANVQAALIWRYVGKREDLIEAVFHRLSAQLVADLEARPLQAMGFERDTVMGRWTVVLAYYALKGAPVPSDRPNPVDTIARTVMTAYGLDETAARLRAAQIVGSALGWRIFEPYLLATSELADTPLDEIRSELTATHRRVGATPWPTTDPPVITDAPSGAGPQNT